MNGPDHFRQAEVMLDYADKALDGELAALVPVYLGHAQVHATLALTAATAANIRRNGSLTVDVDGWDAAFGAPSGNR